MKRFLLLAAACLMSLSAFAQGQPARIIIGTSAPAGGAQYNNLFVDYVHHNFYFYDGTWRLANGGGGISGLTTNTIPKATSSTTIGDSSITDTGSLVTVPNLADKGGQVFNAVAYGWLPDGTDHSTEALALLSIVCPSGVGAGGTIYFPPSTGYYRADSQLVIPVDSSSPQPHTCNLNFTGPSEDSNRNWNAASIAKTAANIDLRYNGNNGAKIETRGLGTIGIKNLTITDGGAEVIYNVTGGTLTNCVVTSNSAVCTASGTVIHGAWVGSAGWDITGATGSLSAMNNIPVFLTAASGSTVTFATTGVSNGTYNNGALTLHYAAPFVHTTNTTIDIRNNTFLGNGSAVQDAIIIGGTSTTIDGSINAAFQGYGTIIDSNQFENLNRWVYERVYANAVVVSNNSGNVETGTRALECSSFGSGQPNSGNIFLNNLFEMKTYLYGIVLDDCTSSAFTNNTYFDPSVNAIAGVYFDDTTGSSDPPGVLLTGYVNGSMPDAKGRQCSAINRLNVIGGVNTSDTRPSSTCANSTTYPTGAVGTELNQGLLVKGTYDSTKNFPGQLSIIDPTSPGGSLNISYDNVVTGNGYIDAYLWNGSVARKLGLNPSGGKVGIGSNSGTLDTCLSRNAAGVLNIENCSGTLAAIRFATGAMSSYVDVTETAAPSNPSASTDRLYADSTSHVLTCLTSSGGSCLLGGATGPTGATGSAGATGATGATGAGGSGSGTVASSTSGQAAFYTASTTVTGTANMVLANAGATNETLTYKNTVGSGVTSFIFGYGASQSTTPFLCFGSCTSANPAFRQCTSCPGGGASGSGIDWVLGDNSDFASFRVKHIGLLGNLFESGNLIVFGTTTATTNAAIISTAQTNPIVQIVNGASGATAQLQVAGTQATGSGDVNVCWKTTGIFTQGAVCGTSARRFKEDISPLEHGLDWLMQMRPVTFRYKPDQNAGSDLHLGFIADDLKGIDPLFAAYAADGQVQNFQDRAVIAALVKAVQEQQAEIESLKVQLANNGL